MFRVVAIIGLMLVVAAPRVRAANADDLFITIYNQIQQADSQVEAGRKSEAYEGYAKAQEDLKRLQKEFPTWNERVINYRLRYLADKLDTLKSFSRPTPSATPSGVPAPPGGTVERELAPEGEVISQFNALNGQIQRLGAEKVLLEAKLREALSAQPAPVDPRQLQEAVEKIASLQQTNKTLLTRLSEQEAERRNLVDRVVAEEAQRALNEANRKLLEQRLAVSKAEKARAEAEAELKQLQDGPVKKLELENAALKNQVTELKTETEKGRQVAELAGKLGRLQTQLEDLKKQNETLATEKAALEKHLSDINVRKAEENIVRIAKLETDLALAQADAARTTQKAEALAVALTQAKAENVQLEEANRSLKERVVDLTRDNSNANATVKRLEAALAEEQGEREQIENKLREAEQKLKALATVPPSLAPGGPPPPASTVPGVVPDPVLSARTSQLEVDVRSLRSSLRESREREVELKNILAEEQAWRAQLQRERTDLEKRLAAASLALTNAPVWTPIPAPAPTLPPLSPSAEVTAALERRVRDLEKQRDTLQQRLVAAGLRLESRMASVRPRLGNPREHAAESRQRR